jgi:hypothetical protein
LKKSVGTTTIKDALVKAVNCKIHFDLRNPIFFFLEYEGSSGQGKESRMELEGHQVARPIAAD